MRLPEAIVSRGKQRDRNIVNSVMSVVPEGYVFMEGLSRIMPLDYADGDLAGAEGVLV